MVTSDSSRGVRLCRETCTTILIGQRSDPAKCPTTRELTLLMNDITPILFGFLQTRIKRGRIIEMSSTPKIDVVYWTASQIYVRCPYCEEIHHHGVALPGRRCSHCFPGGMYEFILPIDECSKLVGYEIDKKRARFTNVGLQSEQDEASSYLGEEDGSDLTSQFRSKMSISAGSTNSGPHLSLYKDATELETYVISDGETFEQKRILMSVSECVEGRVNVVSHYLNTSPEKELFLNGRFDDGDNTLIMVAAEKSCEMVSLLIQNGADVNAVNNHGRTALMGAALWGRIESVKVLLEANADKSLRDGEGRCAMDLAQPTRANKKERYQRSRLAAEDHVFERDDDRRHISLLLNDSEVKKKQRYTTPLSESERNKYGYKKDQSEMAITLVGPLHRHSVPSIYKTAAVLDRGDQFTRIHATSGWAEDALPLNEKTRPTWVEHVYYIASEIGHKFQAASDSRMDQGTPGKFYACHAEKKLIAYFIDRHLFLRHDKEPDSNLGYTIRDAEDSLEEMTTSKRSCKKMYDLECERKALDHELFNADDRLLEDAYDAQEVQRLKNKIHAIEREISNLETDVDVATMRAQERKLDNLWRRYKMHEELRALSASEPSINLKRAVILCSSEICRDCEKFKERVNEFFGLGIEMEWRL